MRNDTDAEAAADIAQPRPNDHLLGVTFSLREVRAVLATVLRVANRCEPESKDQTDLMTAVMVMSLAIRRNEVAADNLLSVDTTAQQMRVLRKLDELRKRLDAIEHGLETEAVEASLRGE